jgi:uncharacterized circularly permuted ATP-grasp superfamily protein/uncharacterized alpha-E superfamily protein
VTIALAMPTGLEALLRGYPRGGHDEMLAADGHVRPSWQRLVEGLVAMGPGGREAAAESTKRALRESGIAFNVYADPDDRRHAWRLDLLPVLLAEGEWARLEQGLVQRARLLDRALADLYGPRTLLRDGTLPAALVLGAEELVRPEVRPDRPDRRFLLVYACDLARTADGSWVVLGDQCDAPMGNGYALASRVALSHGLAELFGACNTRRLATYYQRLQESLLALSGRDDGRIVVQSQGPESPSYFSHAYLARYLGYTLAQSGDLTVRDNQLYLKTLDGLQRVDLLLRKAPGRRADPLSLPGGGFGGVAGLVQAARAERLVLANRLGAGLVQGRALAPFSAALCRRLLGEELRIQDAPTLWLGEAAAREAALARGLPITPAHARNDPGEPAPAIDPAGLAAAARAGLAERLAREGHRFVAQEPVALATTPALDGDRLVPVPWAVRCFVAWGGEDYLALPGGLVRLAGAPTAIGLPSGFGSKDLWIAGERPQPPAPSLLQASLRAVHLRRTGRDLLSRSADNLFWLGRYAERAEASMRLARSVLTRLREDGRPDADPALLRRLLDLVLAKGPPPEAEALDQLVAVLLREPRAYGLRETLDHVHRTATLVRDQISNDAWRMLNALHTDRRWRASDGAMLARPTLELLDDGIRALAAFNGTEAENMTRNWAWRFLEMGRRIERAAQLVELVEALVVDRADPERDGALRLLLELGDSFMTYRSRYLTTPLVAPALDLLLLDETNPRSAAFQLKELAEHCRLLPSEGPHRTPEQRLVLKLLTSLQLAEVTGLAEPDASGRRSALAALLEELGAGLPELSDVIGRTYFAHAEVAVTTVALLRREGA